MAEQSDVLVRKNPAESRYEAVIDGEVVGFAEYREEDGAVVLPHTVVDDAHEGQGVGSALARGALDDIISGAGRVLPQCAFIKGWLEKHPDYQARLTIEPPAGEPSPAPGHRVTPPVGDAASDDSRQESDDEGVGFGGGGSF